MAVLPMTAEDKKWQADSDARTLAEAKVIEKDPARMKIAMNAAKKMAKDRMDEANAMKAVAKKALSKVQKAKPKSK